MRRLPEMGGAHAGSPPAARSSAPGSACGVGSPRPRRYRRSYYWRCRATCGQGQRPRARGARVRARGWPSWPGCSPAWSARGGGGCGRAARRRGTLPLVPGPEGRRSACTRPGTEGTLLVTAAPAPILPRCCWLAWNSPNLGSGWIRWSDWLTWVAVRVQQQRSGVMEMIHEWTLDSNAREAKERLDQKLRNKREAVIKRCDE